MPAKLRELEAATGRPAQEVLAEMFTELRTQVQVAKRLGISQSTLSVWLLKLGLEQRTVLVPVERERAERSA